VIAPPISEAQFQQQIVDLARLRGHRVAHFRPARTASGSWRTPVAADGKGFPDLVIAGRGQLLAVEVKAQHGRVSAEQQGWIDELRKVELTGAMVARPSDWDQIVRLLR
jgi:hypothetical protein